MRGRANLILINGVVVLILIILEVLYESVLVKLKLNFVVVLILIILEVLYEFFDKYFNKHYNTSLNPYYTGSTL